MPLTLPYQQWRYLFQALWLLIIGALSVAGAPPQVWAGLLGAGLVAALFLKRAACSMACPLFAVGELLWRAGARQFGRTFAPPFWFDLLLRSAKYLVLAWVLLAVYDGSILMGGAVDAVPALLFGAAFVLLSLFCQLPWCRYLCPYGALLGLVSMASLLKIRRSPHHCVRCHRCSNRCPASLPVMLLGSVHSPECFACYRCVDGCPAPGALAFALSGGRPIPAWLAGLLLSALLLVCLGAGFLI